MAQEDLRQALTGPEGTWRSVQALILLAKLANTGCLPHVRGDLRVSRLLTAIDLADIATVMLVVAILLFWCM